MKIRRYGKNDLEAILALQGRTPCAAQWLDVDYGRLDGKPGGLILVAEIETVDPPKIVGFVAAHRIVDEAELHNMAVDPDYRGQGVGTTLFDELRSRLLKAGTKQVYLEVRFSNRNALRFYYARGFSLHSIRKGYYHAPDEDAYVLSLELFPPAVV